MATATQISTRALKRLGVLSAGATAAAADITDANEELSAMIASWEGKGLSGDVLPLDPRFETAIIDMLAVRIAPTYGIEPSNRLVADAADGWGTIQAAFFAVPMSRFDGGLVHTGHYSSESGGTTLISDWQASTEYLVRQYVENSGNIYECVTAGTSASSGGPSTAAAEITDGTCVWCFRRVAGA